MHSLVARAQEHGELRSDFTSQDIALLFWGSDRVIELAGDVAPELWRRQLTFVLDGLRSATPTLLPAPPLKRRTASPRGRKARKDVRVSDAVHRQHYNVTFALLAMAAVAYALLQSLVAPALLQIQHDLDTTTTGAAWILTAYLLAPPS